MFTQENACHCVVVIPEVGHGDEIVNQFDLEDVVYPKARETIEETPGNHKEFSENLVRLWTSFAIYG